MTDKGADNSGEFMTPAQVIERYNGSITARTLANWRSTRQGPPYTKIGGVVLYPRAKLLEWEARNTFGTAA